MSSTCTCAQVFRRGASDTLKEVELLEGSVTARVCLQVRISRRKKIRGNFQVPRFVPWSASS